MPWWHDLKPHPLLRCVPRHTAEELDELEKRVLASGAIREPILLVSNGDTGDREIVDGLGRWEVGKRTNIEPRFEDLGRDDEVDVAGVILDYATRRNLSAAQKVRMYLDLNERSAGWQRGREQAQARASAARSDQARAQPREGGGQFGASASGVASPGTRTALRQRDVIARATGTSSATVARVLATRKGAGVAKPQWKEVCRHLAAAARSLGAAADLAAKLDWPDIASQVEKLEQQAGALGARIEEAASLGRREEDAPRDAIAPQPP